MPNPPVLDPSTRAGLILYASLFAARIAYALVLLRWKQATPGKLVVGLQVRRRSTLGALAWSTICAASSSRPAWQAAQIPAAGIGFLILALLDYLWPLWDKNNPALHDKVAGTNVVLQAATQTNPGSNRP